MKIDPQMFLLGMALGAVLVWLILWLASKAANLLTKEQVDTIGRRLTKKK